MRAEGRKVLMDFGTVLWRLSKEAGPLRPEDETIASIKGYPLPTVLGPAKCDGIEMMTAPSLTSS